MLLAADSLDLLRSRIAGDVVSPDDADWDRARQAWNLAADQQPTVVAFPERVDDVVTLVRFAADHGLRVAAQGTGHNASALGPLTATLLLKTERMRGVAIDPQARLARVEAGALWQDVTAPAAAHGLAALAGSSPDVGVVGYTLGGGMSWLGRRYGLAANHVTAIEVVTADGRRLRADAEHHTDLFWALRGGGGGLGVITRLRFALRDVPSVYGGMLVLPASPEVLHGVVAAALEAPDELTVIVQTMLAPPLPFFPPELHGKALVFVQGAYLGDEEAGREAFAPLRALARPLADQVQARPYPSLFEEPEGAPPLRLRFATTFRDSWDLATAERVLALVTAPAAGLRAVQLRPLGGAIARVPDDETAYPHRRRRLLVGTVAGGPPTLDQAPALAWIAEARAALREGDVAFFSFLDAGGATPRDAFPGVWDRLQAVRRAYDPEGVFGAHLAATLD